MENVAGKSGVWNEKCSQNVSTICRIGKQENDSQEYDTGEGKPITCPVFYLGVLFVLVSSQWESQDNSVYKCFHLEEISHQTEFESCRELSPR